ncbi:TPA: hypothetical protein DGT35_00215, partial [Patescibacteria group bacterium]|nr:hypothetical protein [Patescibacteria group bacterium]
MKSKIKNPNGLVWLIVALLVVLFLFNSSTQQDDVIVGAFEYMAEEQEGAASDSRSSIAIERDRIRLDIVKKLNELDDELEQCKKDSSRVTDKCRALLGEIKELGVKFSALKAPPGPKLQDEPLDLDHEDATRVADEGKRKDNLLNHFRGNTDVRYLYLNKYWEKWLRGWVIKDRKGNIIKTVPG